MWCAFTNRRSAAWALGLCFLLLVTIIWSLASFLTQYIYADLDFRSPFILTYISSSFFAVYLPLWQLQVCLGFVKDPPRKRVREMIQSADNDDDYDARRLSFLQRNEDSACSTLTGYIQNFKTFLFEPLLENHSHQDVFYLGLLLMPIWFLGNILYNYSLLMTSISSSTVISNTSGVFTLFFSWYFGIEDISFGKMLGLFLCFIGVILVAIQDEQSSDDASGASTLHSIGGDIVAILGAMLYGLYTSILKLKLQEDDVVSMQLVLGYIGFINCIVCLPVLILVIVQGWDDVNNFTWTIFGFIVLSAVFDDVIADYLWARSVLLTSPTVATVGLSMTIPLAILTDFFSGFFYHNSGNESALSTMSLCGAALVLIGFVFVNVGLQPCTSLNTDESSHDWGNPDIEEQGIKRRSFSQMNPVHRDDA